MELYTKSYNPLLINPAFSLPEEVAVIGAGTIGPDIGYYLKSALPGIKLYLVDVAEAPLKNAEKRLNGYIQKAVDKRKMKPEAARAVGENIFYTTEYADIKNCTLVIEAATENIPLKQKIFETVEGVVSDDTIITSNTSSIPADRIFNKMKNPSRTTVTHFFAPAWRSLPVEVIRWEKSSDDVVDFLFWFFCETGKAPMITDNAICFMLDRIFDNWCNEAAYLLKDATASQIDKVAEEFVFAGPFFVLNMANGNPIITETNTLQMEEGEQYLPAPILASVHRWQTHRPGSQVEVDEETAKTIRDRLLGIFFSQSFDVIDRGIGTREDLNFGCQIALGFRKGPLDVMRDLGEAEVKRVMERFAQERPGFPGPKAPLAEYQDFNRFVLVDRRDDVVIITVRRPQAMNALSYEINDEILSVIQKYENAPDVNGFVITGYGKTAFSAGADIGRFPEVLGDHQGAADLCREYAKLQVFLDDMEKPVVAAINGLALGGGLEVAIRCHGMVSTQKGFFQFPEITLGISPGVGGVVVPYRKWPKGAALFNEMLCFAKPIKAKEAFELGMVSELVSRHSDLIPAAVALVKKLAGNIPRAADGPVDIPPIDIPDNPMAGKQVLSREALQIIAKTVEEGAGAATFADSLEICYDGFGASACTDAAKEGIGAFMEKRKPDFKK